jgi:predicted nuclease of restriction endonuclease-like (RecB) superfamily
MYERMNFEQLIQTIKQTHEHLQNKAISAVNQSLTIRNWLFGLYIVEYEQEGEDHAKYGGKILKNISESLSDRSISGTSERNLRNYRQFYIAYPHIISIIAESYLPESIWQLLTAKSIQKSIKSTTQHQIGVPPELIVNRLSFTHLVELTRESDTLKRAFYETQAIDGNWSVEELKRQMGSLLYERTGLSKNKKKLLKTTKNQSTQLVPADIIRDPYIFEFVGLKQITLPLAFCTRTPTPKTELCPIGTGFLIIHLLALECPNAPTPQQRRGIGGDSTPRRKTMKFTVPETHTQLNIGSMMHGLEGGGIWIRW